MKTNIANILTEFTDEYSGDKEINFIWCGNVKIDLWFEGQETTGFNGSGLAMPHVSDHLGSYCDTIEEFKDHLQAVEDWCLRVAGDKKISAV